MYLSIYQDHKSSTSLRRSDPTSLAGWMTTMTRVKSKQKNIPTNCERHTNSCWVLNNVHAKRRQRRRRRYHAVHLVHGALNALSSLTPLTPSLLLFLWFIEMYEYNAIGVTCTIFRSWVWQIYISNLHTKFGQHFVNMETAVEWLSFPLSLSVCKNSRAAGRITETKTDDCKNITHIFMYMGSFVRAWSWTILQRQSFFICPIQPPSNRSVSTRVQPERHQTIQKCSSLLCSPSGKCSDEARPRHYLFSLHVFKLYYV